MNFQPFRALHNVDNHYSFVLNENYYFELKIFQIMDFIDCKLFNNPGKFHDSIRENRSLCNLVMHFSLFSEKSALKNKLNLHVFAEVKTQESETKFAEISKKLFRGLKNMKCDSE